MRLLLRSSLVFFCGSLVVFRPGAAQDIASGRTYFSQNCAICHSVTPDLAAGQGPGLFGVVGRKAGSAPGFGYTDALSKAGAKGLVWNASTLETFLSAPDQFVSGTAMPLNVASAEDRTNLIGYFKTLMGTGDQPALAQSTPDHVAPAPDAAAFDAWRDDHPGVSHHITLQDLPDPFTTGSVSNSPKIVPQPEGAHPQVPDGFKVTVFTKDVDRPRMLITAPNGDVFVAETNKGQIRLLRGGETADQTSLFAEGLSRPFGMAFYPSGANPRYLYVGNNDSIIRFPYANGDLTARGPAETIVATLSKTTGGHTTRPLVFTPDGKHMVVSIGSASNVAESIAKTPPQPLVDWDAQHGVGGSWDEEEGRAALIMFDPDGGHRQVFATGIRNCVGLGINPATQDVMCSTNERDKLGDNLPPDYFTRVPRGAFFGWPWYYMGDHEDPRHSGERPDLAGKVSVPDLFLQPHSAPLGFAFYSAPKGAPHAFPASYEGSVFLALHGSWNRALRTGEKIVRIQMKNGVPSPSYEDFMTGFIVDDQSVWGRPVAVTVARDGALLVSDDNSSTIWRISPK